MKKVYSLEVKEAVRKLRCEGRSIGEISRLIHVPETCVGRWVKGIVLPEEQIRKICGQKRDENTLAKLKEMVAKHLSPDQMATILKVHRITITKWLKRYQILLPQSHALHSAHVCALCEKKTSSRRRICGTCNVRIRRYRAKKKAVEYLGGICQCCGYAGSYAAFDFHHIGGKDFALGNSMSNKKWEIIVKELDKCILLCAICHRLEHSKYEDEKMVTIASSIGGLKIFRDITG